MNASGVQSTIDISVNTKGLQQAIQQVRELSKEEQKLAKLALDLALKTEKVATQQAKTATEMEKTRLATEKVTSQITKDAQAKEQNALKTEKLRLQLEKLNNTNNKTSKGFSLSSFNLLKMGVNFNNLIGWGKKAGEAIYALTSKTVDYVETLNLFEVSMGNTVLVADDFVKEISEAFNLDDKSLRDAISTFNLLGTQFGLTNGQALEWSETLTKLAIDTSSLRNTDLETALTKIRAGISGEIEPLRQWGIDLTENTLKQEALANGITKQYSAMSYGEKSLLRYSALLRQTTADQGDFARTLDTPAQLLKQIKEQFEALARAIGNLFLPLLKQVLPYVLGLILALKEVVIWLGTIFGISVQDVGLENLQKTSQNIANNLGGAVKSAKELKKWLGGYDELNNVTPQTSSSSGTGNMSLGIDPEFMNLLRSYDNGMKNVSSKAKEIRDSIMSWLGFIYDAEKSTYRLKDGWQNIHTIVTLIGGAIALWAIPKVIGLVGGIAKSFGTVLSVVKGISDFTGISTLFSSIGTSATLIGDGMMSWGTVITKFVIPSVIKVISTLGGIVAIVFGISESFKGVAKILDGDVKSGIGKVVEGISLIVGGLGLLVGGPVGWAVAFGAGTVALISGVYSWLVEDKRAILDIDEAVKRVDESQRNLNEAIERYTSLTDELKSAKEALTKAEEALTEEEREQAETGEELYQKVQDGTINVKDLSDAQFDLYNAYSNVRDIEKETTEAKEKMSEAQKENVKQSLEEQLSLATTSGEYDNLKDAIYDAMDKGMISVGDARDYFERAMGDMSEDSKQTFMADIPEDIQEGMNPNKYDNNFTQMKNAFRLFGQDVETGLSDKFISITDNIRKKVSEWGPIGEKIGTLLIDGIIKMLNSGIDKINKKLNISISKNVAKILQGLGIDVESGTYQLFTIPNIPTIGKYEQGGMPDIGSLFVAGEGNGAEFVGNIGGRTNVINEAQLENALYRATVRANSGSSRENIIVENYIGGNKTDSILTKRSRRRNNITGGDSRIYG